MAFDNAKRILRNDEARVATSASGIYDDNLVLLYWENIESKYIDECVRYFNDSSTRVMYTDSSTGVVTFYDTSFDTDLYHLHAYYSASDERFYRVLMKSAATSAAYTQSGTKWRTMSGTTYESGTSNLVLVIHNVDANSITALESESIPETITGGIYLIGGTELTGTWYNISRQSQYNSSTGLYDLRWFIARYNSKEYIFRNIDNNVVNSVEFFKHHMTSSGITDFEQNYYFDSNTLGDYYYSTDGSNYTKKNNVDATGSLPATAKNIITQVSGRNVQYEQRPNRENGEIDISLNIRFVDSIQSQASSDFQEYTQTVTVKRNTSSVDSVGTPADGTIITMEATPNPDGTFDTVRTYRVFNGRGAASGSTNAFRGETVLITNNDSAPAGTPADQTDGTILIHESEQLPNNLYRNIKRTIVARTDVADVTDSTELSDAGAGGYTQSIVKKYNQSSAETILESDTEAGTIVEVENNINEDGTYNTIKSIRTERSLTAEGGSTNALNKEEIIITVNAAAELGEPSDQADGIIISHQSEQLPNGLFRNTQRKVTARTDVATVTDSTEVSDSGLGGYTETITKKYNQSSQATINESDTVAGSIVNVENTINEDGTFNTIERVRTPRSRSGTGGNSSVNSSETILTVINAATELGAPSSPSQGTTVIHESIPQDNGLFRNTTRTITREERVEDTDTRNAFYTETVEIKHDQSSALTAGAPGDKETKTFISEEQDDGTFRTEERTRTYNEVTSQNLETQSAGTKEEVLITLNSSRKYWSSDTANSGDVPDAVAGEVKTLDNELLESGKFKTTIRTITSQSQTAKTVTNQGSDPHIYFDGNQKDLLFIPSTDYTKNNRAGTFFIDFELDNDSTLFSKDDVESASAEIVLFSGRKTTASDDSSLTEANTVDMSMNVVEEKTSTASKLKFNGRLGKYVSGTDIQDFGFEINNPEGYKRFRIAFEINILKALTTGNTSANTTGYFVFYLEGLSSDGTTINKVTNTTANQLVVNNSNWGDSADHANYSLFPAVINSGFKNGDYFTNSGSASDHREIVDIRPGKFKLYTFGFSDCVNQQSEMEEWVANGGLQQNKLTFLLDPSRGSVLDNGKITDCADKNPNTLLANVVQDKYYKINQTDSTSATTLVNANIGHLLATWDDTTTLSLTKGKWFKATQTTSGLGRRILDGELPNTEDVYDFTISGKVAIKGGASKRTVEQTTATTAKSFKSEGGTINDADDGETKTITNTIRPDGKVDVVIETIKSKTRGVENKLQSTAASRTININTSSPNIAVVPDTITPGTVVEVENRPNEDGTFTTITTRTTMSNLSSSDFTFVGTSGTNIPLISETVTTNTLVTSDNLKTFAEIQALRAENKSVTVNVTPNSDGTFEEKITTRTITGSKHSCLYHNSSSLITNEILLDNLTKTELDGLLEKESASAKLFYDKDANIYEVNEATFDESDPNSESYIQKNFDGTAGTFASSGTVLYTLGQSTPGINIDLSNRYNDRNNMYSSNIIINKYTTSSLVNHGDNSNEAFSFIRYRSNFNDITLMIQFENTSITDRDEFVSSHKFDKNLNFCRIDPSNSNNFISFNGTSTGSKTQTQMYTEFNNAPLTSGWNEVINHFSAYQLNSLKDAVEGRDVRYITFYDEREKNYNFQIEITQAAPDIRNERDNLITLTNFFHADRDADLIFYTYINGKPAFIRNEGAITVNGVSETPVIFWDGGSWVYSKSDTNLYVPDSGDLLYKSTFRPALDQSLPPSRGWMLYDSSAITSFDLRSATLSDSSSDTNALYGTYNYDSSTNEWKHSDGTPKRFSKFSQTINGIERHFWKFLTGLASTPTIYSGGATGGSENIGHEWFSSAILLPPPWDVSWRNSILEDAAFEDGGYNDSELTYSSLNADFSNSINAVTSKNITSEVSEGFNLNAKELRKRAERFSTLKASGVNLTFNHSKNADGLYDYKTIITRKNGVIDSFKIGNKYYYYGDQVSKPPSTDIYADEKYFNIIRLSDDNNDVSANVIYNHSNDTYTYQIIENITEDPDSLNNNTTNNSDIYGRAADTQLPMFTDGSWNIRRQVWMYRNVTYLPKQVNDPHRIHQDIIVSSPTVDVHASALTRSTTQNFTGDGYIKWNWLNGDIKYTIEASDNLMYSPFVYLTGASPSDTFTGDSTYTLANASATGSGEIRYIFGSGSRTNSIFDYNFYRIRYYYNDVSADQNAITTSASQAAEVPTDSDLYYYNTGGIVTTGEFAYQRYSQIKYDVTINDNGTYDYVKEKQTVTVPTPSGLYGTGHTNNNTNYTVDAISGYFLVGCQVINRVENQLLRTMLHGPDGGPWMRLAKDFPYRAAYNTNNLTGEFTVGTEYGDSFNDVLAQVSASAAGNFNDYSQPLPQQAATSLTNSNEINFAGPHLRSDNDRIYYLNNGSGSELTGLDSGKSYYVKTTSNPNTLQLRTSTSGAVLNISLPSGGNLSDHLFQTSYYATPGSTSYIGNTTTPAHTAFDIETTIDGVTTDTQVSPATLLNWNLQLCRSRKETTYVSKKYFVIPPPQSQWLCPNVDKKPDGTSITDSTCDISEKLTRLGDNLWVVEKTYTEYGAWTSDTRDSYQKTHFGMSFQYWGIANGLPHFPNGNLYNPQNSSAVSSFVNAVVY